MAILKCKCWCHIPKHENQAVSEYVCGCEDDKCYFPDFNPEEFTNIANKAALDLAIQTPDFIELELKEISKKYNVPPELLVLSVRNYGNVTFYDVSIKVTTFSIENKFVMRG